MATVSFGGAEDDDVLGKAISDYEARDTCEINVKKGKCVILCACVKLRIR